MKRRSFLRSSALVGAALSATAAGCSSSIAGQGTAGSVVPVAPSSTATPTTMPFSLPVPLSTLPPSSGASATAAPIGATTQAPVDGVIKADLARMVPTTGASAAGKFYDLAAAMLKFRLGSPDSGNAVISPYSIVSALGMVSLGARGAARTAFAKLLGGTNQEVADRLTATDAALAAAVDVQSSDQAQVPVVQGANAVYADQTLELQQLFLDGLARGYGAGVRVEDFQTAPDKALADINSWVSDRTRGLIPTLLSAAQVTADTRLVLVNALYVKASWNEPFELGAELSFVTATGQKVSPAKVLSGQSQFDYAKGPGWQSVSIPYVGSALSFTVVLPDSGSAGAIPALLTGDLLGKAIESSSELVEITMPGFAAQSSQDLVAMLTALGAGAVFAGADLSGIAGRPGDLKIGAVTHKVKISVNENGTEAAAATAVELQAGAAAPAPNPPKPIRFTVDRPFLYFISESTTGTPLFLGVVADPTV